MVSRGTDCQLLPAFDVNQMPSLVGVDASGDPSPMSLPMDAAGPMPPALAEGPGAWGCAPGSGFARAIHSEPLLAIVVRGSAVPGTKELTFDLTQVAPSVDFHTAGTELPSGDVLDPKATSVPPMSTHPDMLSVAPATGAGDTVPACQPAPPFEYHTCASTPLGNVDGWLDVCTGWGADPTATTKLGRTRELGAPVVVSAAVDEVGAFAVVVGEFDGTVVVETPGRVVEVEDWEVPDVTLQVPFTKAAPEVAEGVGRTPCDFQLTPSLLTHASGTPAAPVPTAIQPLLSRKVTAEGEGKFGGKGEAGFCAIHETPSLDEKVLRETVAGPIVCGRSTSSASNTRLPATLVNARGTAFGCTGPKTAGFEDGWTQPFDVMSSR